MNRKHVIILTAIAITLLFTADIGQIYGNSVHARQAKSALSYYGSTGQEVKNIQYRLRSWGYYSGSIDGVYGPRTYDAVRYFQSKNGLKVDGVAGAQTLAALGLPSGAAVSRSTSGTASRDVTLLAHLVEGEARGEIYEGQVAVAAVVLNRVADSRFPNTIAGVIYQPGAFTAVDDGQINLTPSDTSYRAARDALSGWDPSGGAVYYFNPVTATNKWIWSRPQIKQIGKHIFTR